MPSRAGSTNKNKAFLLKRLQDMYGDEFHPIMNMAENAMKMQVIVNDEPTMENLKSSIDAWDKIAQYTEPKLKAVEVKGDGGGPVKIKSVIEGVAPDAPRS